MTALVRFLKVLLLVALVIAMVGVVMGVGYWRYNRQAELLDGFEYLGWRSDYQHQIKTIEDGENREFKVMELARRYRDHWVTAFLFPDAYVNDEGESRTGYLAFNFYWDADCIDGTEIDTGVALGDGTAKLQCVGGDKLQFSANYHSSDEDLWSDMPDHVFELGGYAADTGRVKYLPWEEARRFATLQKATTSSEAE